MKCELQGQVLQLPACLANAKKQFLYELQYAQTSGTTYIFFYVQTFIGNPMNKESINSHPHFGLTQTGTAWSHSPTPLLTTLKKYSMYFFTSFFNKVMELESGRFGINGAYPVYFSWLPC